MNFKPQFESLNSPFLTHNLPGGFYVSCGYEIESFRWAFPSEFFWSDWADSHLRILPA